MSYEPNRRVKDLIKDLNLKDDDSFLYQFDILVKTAKEIARQLTSGSALSNKKINSELTKLSTLTNSYAYRFCSLSPVLVKELDIQHKRIEQSTISNKFPLNRHVNNVLCAICECCENSTQIRKRVKLPGKLPPDLAPVLQATNIYREKLNSLHNDVWVKLDAQYIKSGMSIFEKKYSWHKHVFYILITIFKYCDLAKQANNKTSHYTNLECLLADEFEKFGGIIKKADKGSFAKLLRIFREECNIPSFPSYSVNAMEVSRIEKHRKDKLHLRKLF